MAGVAIAHGDPHSSESFWSPVGRTQTGRPEAIAVNGFKGGEPEDLVGEAPDRGANILQTSFRCSDDENSKLWLPEGLLKVALRPQACRYSAVFFCQSLVPPCQDRLRETSPATVRDCPISKYPSGISRCSGHKRLLGRSANCRRVTAGKSSESDRCVNFVDLHLVLDKEIARQRSDGTSADARQMSTPTSWPLWPTRCTSPCDRRRWCQRRNSAEVPHASVGVAACLRASWSQSRNNLCQFPVNDPHPGNFLQQHAGRVPGG